MTLLVDTPIPLLTPSPTPSQVYRMYSACLLPPLPYLGGVYGSGIHVLPSPEDHGQTPTAMAAGMYRGEMVYGGGCTYICSGLH